MTVKLVDDIIYNILLFIAGSPSSSSSRTLRSWTLTNSLWFRIATPLLWRDPFSIVLKADPVSRTHIVRRSISLLDAYIGGLPEEEMLTIDLFANSKRSTVNYAQFITAINEGDLRRLLVVSDRFRRNDIDAVAMQLFRFFLKSSLVLKTLSFNRFIPEGNLPKSIQNLSLTYFSTQNEEVLRLINIQENLVELTVEKWGCNFFEFLDKLSNLKNSLIKLTFVNFIIHDNKENLEYLRDIRIHFPKLEQLVLTDSYDSNTFFVLSRELQDSFTLMEKSRDFKKWVTKSNV